jgi:hypothetical protein
MATFADVVREAPLGAVLLGAVGLTAEAFATGIFLRRVMERERAEPARAAELQQAVRDVVPLLPIGLVLWALALVWWAVA